MTWVETWPEIRSPAEVLADGLFILVHRGFFPDRAKVAAAADAVGLSLEDLRLAATRLEGNPARYRPPAGSVRAGVIGGASPAPSAPVESAVSTPAAVDASTPTAPVPLGTNGAARPATVPRDSRPPSSHDSHPHGGHRPDVSGAIRSGVAATNPRGRTAPAPTPGPRPTAADFTLVCERCGRAKPAAKFARRGGAGGRHARNCLVCEWLIQRRRHYEAALGHELLTRHAHTLTEGDPLLDGRCVLDCGVALMPGAEVVGVEVLVAHLGCFRAATAPIPLIPVVVGR